MITRETRLSELRQIVRDQRSTDERDGVRVVKSIQQSLAAEGIVCSEELVRKAGEKVRR